MSTGTDLERYRIRECKCERPCAPHGIKRPDGLACMYDDPRNGQPTGRSGTCNVCRRKRKLYRYRSFYERCEECLPLVHGTPEFAAAVDSGKKKVKERNAKGRLAYPIIGGPLDGLHAQTDDFYSGSTMRGYERDAGMYHHLADEYVEFNCASGGRKQIGGFPPSMVWIHRDLLQPLKRPADR